MVNINKYIKALLHPTGGHQGRHKAHQAGNQNEYTVHPKKYAQEERTRRIT